MLSSSEILQLQLLQQSRHSTATLSAREPLALPLVFDRQMPGWHHARSVWQLPMPLQSSGALAQLGP